MESKGIEKDTKQLVINATKSICNTVSEHINTMVVLEKADFKELATIKGLLDAVLIMIQELPANGTETDK